MTNESDISIVDEGNIGEKARQLVEKTPELKKIGFSVPHRTVLAEGFFDGFFQRNGLGAGLTEAEPIEDLATKIIKGSFPADDFNRLREILARYGNRPLVIRSSAEGDARGTGIYKSEFSENSICAAREALQRVLASYYSQDAIAFRKDAKTGEGFGIIIEPLIGQEIGSVFAPVLSGFAYSSTSSGEGYINVVPGIGGGVETRNGERLTRSSLEPYEGNLNDYIYKQRRLMKYGLIAKRESSLLNSESHIYSGIAYNIPNQFEKIGFGSSGIRFDYKLSQDFRRLNLSDFFDKLQAAEEIFGKPQYLEWAMTLEKDPMYWIVQIADVDKKLETFEFEDFGQSFIEGHSVKGSAIEDSQIRYFNGGGSRASSRAGASLL